MWRQAIIGLLEIGMSLRYIYAMIVSSPKWVEILNPETYPIWVEVGLVVVGVLIGVRYADIIAARSVDLLSVSDSDLEHRAFLRNIALVVPLSIFVLISFDLLGYLRKWIIFFPLFVSIVATTLLWCGVLSLGEALSKSKS